MANPIIGYLALHHERPQAEGATTCARAHRTESCLAQAAVQSGATRVASMSNAHQPAAMIAFTEFEEAFFRAGELLSEADPPADTSALAPDRRRWSPWPWLFARLRLGAAPASGR